MTDAGEFTIVATSAGEFASENVVTEGRVSPKRMLNAPGARIMNLAFDAGAELKEHTAPVPILIQAVAGSVTVSVSGQDILLGAGGLVHIDATVPHAVSAAEPEHVMLTLLR